MRKLLVLVIILQYSIHLIGQVTQKVILEIYPPNSFLKIDKDVINVNEKDSPFVLDLTNGIYPIEIWATNYEIFRDTILVEGKTKKYSKGLIQQSTYFKEFKKAKRQSNTKKFGKAGITSAIIVANIGGLWYSIGNTNKNNLNDLQRKAQDLEDKHLNISTETALRENRIQYEQIQSDFEKEKRTYNLKRTVGIPLFCLTSVFSGIYLSKLWKKKIDTPILKEEKNPFVLRNIELNTFDASCQLNLKFEF